jgi:hypothetical protein
MLHTMPTPVNGAKMASVVHAVLAAPPLVLELPTRTMRLFDWLSCVDTKRPYTLTSYTSVAAPRSSIHQPSSLVVTAIALLLAALFRSESQVNSPSMARPASYGPPTAVTGLFT